MKKVGLAMKWIHDIHTCEDNSMGKLVEVMKDDDAILIALGCVKESIRRLEIFKTNPVKYIFELRKHLSDNPNIVHLTGKNLN